MKLIMTITKLSPWQTVATLKNTDYKTLIRTYLFTTKLHDH